MARSLVRLLSVGDVHVDATPPSSRKDNFWETTQQKLLEVRKLALENHVSVVVWKGDLFNKKESQRVPYHVTNWLVGYFASFESVAIVNFLAMGNHDIDKNPTLWERQPIGNVVRHASVEPLWSNIQETGGAISWPLTQLKVGVSIWGRMYSYDQDKVGKRRAYYGLKRVHPEEFRIAAVHGELLPNGEKFITDYTTPADIEREVPADERSDLYLCGHVHDDIGVFRGSDGAIYENRGALTRGSIDEYNLNRTVQVTVIQVNDDHTTEIETLPLQCAKPAAEVFYLNELKQKRRHDAHTAYLTNLLSSQALTDTFKVTAPDTALKVLMDSKNTTPAVRARVEAYVRQATQRLGM